MTKGKEIDLKNYKLESLQKEIIPEFKVTNPIEVNNFFIKLENILVPVSGERFKTHTWIITASLSVKIGAKVIVLNFGKTKEDLENVEHEIKRIGAEYEIIIKNEKVNAKRIIATFQEGNYQLICINSCELRFFSFLPAIFRGIFAQKHAEN